MPDKAYNRLPTERARGLRNHATPAERKLWSALNNRKLGGVRFNRQVPIGPFICDLVARTQRLIVEVDGGQHSENRLSDEKRTVFLQSKGYRVLRFWNNDVIGNLEGVVTTIANALIDNPSSPPPARAGGEEARSAEGEGLSSANTTCPPPLASRVDPTRTGGWG